ncbi:MAG TPA: hypothetical protein VHL09_02025, partial [Dehalococcoidia bacterium]|nr:hypothetical protein [Dehalococcoidia bacterium]
AVRYRDETYAIADTTLIIAAVVGSRGQARLRLAALEDRLNWLSEALRRQGKPRLTSIRLATSDSVESLPGVVLAEAKHVVKLPRR